LDYTINVYSSVYFFIVLKVQAARTHVFEELSQEHPSVKILCDILTIREATPTVRTGPAMANE
jgi:hypothetical protein